MKQPIKLLQLLQANMRAEGGAQPPLRAESTDTELHVYVYDVIDGWFGCSAAQLVAALAAAGERAVHLHVNSPGGDVFEGRAMASAIVAHPGPVVAHIDGLAASAATYVALAASEVRMTEGGMLMIHNSWTLAMGDRNDLRSTADLLEKIDGQLANDYMRRTGASLEQVQAWLDAETWFTADEALAAKFVDVVDPNTQREAGKSARALAASWDLKAYANAPALEAPTPESLDVAAIECQRQHNRNRMRVLQLTT